MDDPQALATLRRIEKLLEDSLAVGRAEQRQNSEAQRRKVGPKKGDEPDFTDLNRQVIRATVRMGILAEQADKLGTTARKARGDLDNFRRGVRFATTTTRSAFDGISSAAVRSSAVVTDAAKLDAELSAEAADNSRSSAESRKRQEAETGKFSSFLNGMLGRFGSNLRDGGDKAEWLRSQFVNLGWAVADAAINVTRDLYHLQARGISAGDSLFELYGNAMKAGMSLQEYTTMMQENSAAVVRAGSFSEFGDSVDRTTRQLNRLGVFGPAAENLAAALRTSAVTVGISREQQEKAINSQVKLFEQLRKTTLMTAEAFRELQADIANNQMVQEELLGLAPQERAARLQQITQGATIGYQLGATAQASKQLQDALLAQRRATVEDRFKAAGMIRMGGAMMGMDTSRVEEYARLMMKNPALRTEEEKKRIAELAGDYQQFLQALKSSPNPALENIADKIAQLSPAVQAELQAAAGTVKLQAEAGRAQNAEIGKETSGFMQDIGRGLTTLSGFMKNPLADAMVIFGSILAQTVVQSSLLAIIAKNTGSTGGIFKLFGKKPGDAAGKAGKGGALASFGSFLAETFSSAAGIDITGRRAPGEIGEKGIGARIAAQNEAKAAEKAAKAARVARGDTLLTRLLTPIFGNMFGMSALNSLNFTAEGDLVPEQTKKGIVSRLGDGLKSSMGKIFGIFKSAGPFSIIFGAIEEAFTGEMAAAMGFGDDIGGRLLGVFVGGLNSFFTGITRLVDGGFNLVMEGLGISVRSNFTKVFDIMTLVLTMGAKTIMSSFARVVSDIIGFFNKDAPWAKSLREFSDRQDAQVVAQAETLKTLWNTEGATLRSMGEEHIKAQKETADKSKQLSKATTNNVVMGVENLLGAVKATAAAQTVQVQPGASATTAIATPQPTQQSAVTPPEVNRQSTELTQTKSAAAAADGTLTIVGMQELISNTQQQLDVLRQLLMMGTNLAAGEGTQVRLSRPTFSDNAEAYNQFNNQLYNAA